MFRVLSNEEEPILILIHLLIIRKLPKSHACGQKIIFAKISRQKVKICVCSRKILIISIGENLLAKLISLSTRMSSIGSRKKKKYNQV